MVGLLGRGRADSVVIDCLTPCKIRTALVNNLRGKPIVKTGGKSSYIVETSPGLKYPIPNQRISAYFFGSHSFLIIYISITLPLDSGPHSAQYERRWDIVLKASLYK